MIYIFPDMEKKNTHTHTHTESSEDDFIYSLKPLIQFNHDNYYICSQFGLVGRVFAKGLEDQGSIPGPVILKTQKMVLDATLLKTQHYKVEIKGKVVQSRERSSTLPNTSV